MDEERNEMKHFRAFLAALAGWSVCVGAVSHAPQTAWADGPSDEQQFLQAVRTLPMYVLPSRIPADEDLLGGGYRACALMDQYPDQPMTVLYVYYKGGNTVDGKIYLCDRHSDMYPQVAEDGLYGN
jgi:hypothetical protein